MQKQLRNPHLAFIVNKSTLVILSNGECSFLEFEMQNYILVVSDLVRTLLETHPLPWASLVVGEERHVIATSTKVIILKTHDAAVAGEVLTLANSLGMRAKRKVSEKHVA